MIQLPFGFASRASRPVRSVASFMWAPRVEWQSAIFHVRPLDGQASSAGLSWDVLSAGLNDANLHVVDIRPAPQAAIEIRYNPLAYSSRRVASRLRSCGFEAEELPPADGPSRVSARLLWSPRT